MMKSKSFIGMARALPLLAVTVCGCATHTLWSQKVMDNWNEPAANPNLRVFQNERGDDFLVVYDEYSERHDASRLRAFWTGENDEAVAQHRAPTFVAADKAASLRAVPVFWQTNAPVASGAAGLCAMVSTNHQSFELVCDGRVVAAHSLPVYNDRLGKVERVAVTPLTAAADLTIIGGYIFYAVTVIRS